MIEMFRLNGEVYCKLYAWTPVRTSNPNDHQWIWFDHYYVRTSRRGRRVVIMTREEFFLDYNRRG